MYKLIIVGITILLSTQVSIGQRFQASLSSNQNTLELYLSPADGDFEEIEIGQIEFFIRTAATSRTQIRSIVVDVNNFGGNIPVRLLNDRIDQEYRVLHFGYSMTPSVVKKSYIEGSNYLLTTIALSGAQQGEIFELVADTRTYETYLNITSSKGEDLAPVIELDNEEFGIDNSLFIGERKRKEDNLLLQGTQINLEEVSIDTPTLFATDNISVETFPNPVIDKVQVQINAEQADKLKVSVQDINGQIIQTKMIEVNEGINQVQFNLKQLTSGTYFINAQSDTIKFSHKISVLH